MSLVNRHSVLQVCVCVFVFVFMFVFVFVFVCVFVCVCLAPSIACRCLQTTSPALPVGFQCEVDQMLLCLKVRQQHPPAATCFTLAHTAQNNTHVFFSGVQNAIYTYSDAFVSERFFPMCLPQSLHLSIAHHSVPARARRPCAELPVTVRNIPEHRFCESVGAAQIFGQTHRAIRLNYVAFENDIQ